jgi:predicted GNAT family acetyltransferase
MAAVVLDEFHIRSPKGLSAVLVLTDQGKERRGMQETADCLIEYIRKIYPYLFAAAGCAIDYVSAADAPPTEGVTAVNSVKDELERELAELRGEVPSSTSATGSQQGVKRKHGGKTSGGPPKGAKRARHDDEGAACGGAPAREEPSADPVSTGEAASSSRPPRPQRLLCRFAEQCRGVGLVWFPHPSVDMLRVVDALVDDLAADRLPRTRSAHRLVPLQRVVSGFTADVVAAAQDLVAHGFGGAAGCGPAPVEGAAAGASSSSSLVAAPQPAPTGAAGWQAALPLSDTQRPTTWAAEFSCRNNSSVAKNEVYAALGRAVPSVHLLVRETRGPATEATVLVEVVGRFAGVSVVRGFRYSRSLRYNVRLLTESEVEKRVRMAEAAAATAKSKSGGGGGGGGAAASASAEATGSSAEAATVKPAPLVVGAAAALAAERAVSAPLPSTASSDGASDPAPRLRHTPAQHAEGGELVAGSEGELRLAVRTSGAADGAEDAADALLQYRLVAAQLHTPGVAAGSAASVQGAASGSSIALEITHTYTPPAARGKGLAQALTLAALRWAVRCGVHQVLPSCTYVASTFLQRYSRGGEATDPLAEGASSDAAAASPAPPEVAVEELRVRVLHADPHTEGLLWLLR